MVLAALDHGRTIPPEVPDEGDFRREFMDHFLRGYTESTEAYPDRRFRARIRILIADPEMQRRYWRERVVPRRAPLYRAFERAIARGELRSELEIWPAMDLLIGVLYYQIIVRGERPNDPEALARIEAAVDIVWRGLLAKPGGADGSSPEFGA
nr:TetR-like C-terminal domain-containing protein [Leucobacter edaphi]